jgi:plastocyanin
VAHLISKDMQFGPDTLRVQVGEAITLQLDNKDLYAHSFDIDALDVHAAMPANSRNTLNFKAHHPGKFSFYCGVPGHEAAGMVGTIIVEN